MFERIQPYVAGAALVTTVLTGCSTGQESKPVVPTTEANAEFGQAQQAVNYYEGIYGKCPIPITFKDVASVPENATGETTIAEVTEPGVITLTNTYRSGSPKDRYDAILHETTHACVEEPTKLLEPIKYSGGVITGFNGFMLDVVLNDGEATRFTRIEEATAEALAVSAEPTYETHSLSYLSIGKAMLRVMTFDHISPQQLSDMHRSNDVMSFVSIVTHTPKPQVKVAQIEQVMTEFEYAYDHP